LRVWPNIVTTNLLLQRLGVRQEIVNKDLLLYKSILSKLTAAKELMKETLERERRKQAERDAAKAGSSTGEQAPAKESSETVNAEA
jgi:hypothetical protein